MANYNPDDLLKKMQQAKQAGVPDDVISKRVKAQYGVDPSQLQATPFTQKLENNWLVGPAVKFGGTALEAGKKIVNLATSPEYRQAQFGDAGALTEAQQRRVAELDKPMFISEHQQEYTRAHPAMAAAKNAAGAASYVIPAGKTLKTAVGLGAAMGGLRAFSEEKANVASVAGGATGGAVAGGLIYGAGKGIEAIKSGLNKTKASVGKMATQEYLKESPTAWANAMREHGIDPNVVVNKYIPQGIGYDDALSVVKDQLGTAEGVIQKTADIAGKNVRISGDDVLAALEQEGTLLKGQLGSEAKSKALDKIIEQAQSKYKKGITVKQAVELLHYANNKFGKSIIDTGGDAVATSAQKLEANTMRTALKGMFPEIAGSLRTEEELLTLRPILEMARAKANVAGFPDTPWEFIKEQISPKLANKLRGAGQIPAIPNTPAELSTVIKEGRSSLQPGSTTLFSPQNTPIDDLVAQKATLVDDFKALQNDFLEGKIGGQGTYQTRLADITQKINNINSLLEISPKPAPVVPALPFDQIMAKNKINGVFDQAIYNKDWTKVTELLPTVSPDYATRYVDYYPEALKKLVGGLSNVVPSTPAGLQPGSVDLGYISDFMKSGPPAKPPSLTGGAIQLGALGGARIIGGDGGVPTTPAGLNQTITTTAPPANNAADQARLAQLMLKYPKYATQIKNAYDVAHKGTSGGNVGKVAAQNYSNSVSGLSSLNQANSLIFNPSGELDRATIIALKTPGTPSQKSRQLKAHLYNVADSYLRLRTGAQANPDEIRRLADSLEPGLLDNADTIRTKLNIYNNVFGKYIELAKSGGISDVPETPAGLTNQ